MLKPLTFVIYAENQLDLLARTIMLFHRLAIQIYGLTMHRPAGDSNLRIEIVVLADPLRSERIIVSLGKIVHVLAVKARSFEAEPFAQASSTTVDTQ
jgi:acetolactate synthase small subunit